MVRFRPADPFILLFCILTTAIMLPSAVRSQPIDASAGCVLSEKPLPGQPPCLEGQDASAVAYRDITSAGPLTHIFAGVDASVQVAHALDGATYEFYPSHTIPGDSGTFLVVDGVLYAPHFANHGGTATSGLGSYTQFTTVSQTAVLGAGTAADPYRVVTVVAAGSTGVRIIQTDTYQVGLEAYRTDLQVSNSSGAGHNIILYRAGDCYLGASDFGYGMVASGVGAVACTKNANNNPEGRILQYVPLSGGSRYYEANYAQVWTWIGSKQVFPNTCRCTELIDNGAGLSWNQTLPAGGQVTWSHMTAFSPLGSLPLTLQKTADTATSAPGTANGYTITVSNPNASAVVLTALMDDLPAGFSYVTNSTTGLTTANPSISGQTLTWSGQFSVPAGGSRTLHFNVNVSATPGAYTNTARGTATNFSVSSAQNTAPITVSAQVGAVDMGFRVNPDGYSFANYGGNTPADLTIDDLVRMFGRDAVCTNTTGTCQPREAASTWRDQVVNAMSGGHCDGFTTTALRFFKDIDQQSTFQSGAASTYALTQPNMGRRIAYFWALQVPNPVGAARNNALSKTPTQVLQQLFLAMSGSAPDPVTLIIYNAAGNLGHSVLPYAIEDAGNGIYRVRVYDNNHPNDANRRVTINTTNNTWSYDLGGGLGTWNGWIGVIALSTYAQQPACPWCAGATRQEGPPPPTQPEGVAATPRVQTWAQGDGDVLVTDNEGRRLGTVGGQFIDEMPDGFASVLPGGLGQESQPVFYLPENKPLTLGVTGEFGQARLVQYGPGYAVVVDGVIVSPQSNQQMGISADGRSLSLTPTTSQTPDLTLIAESGNSSLSLGVSDSRVEGGDTVSLRRDPNSGQFIYSRRDAGQGTYTLDIRRVTSSGPQSFSHGQISIGASDTHYVQYGSWTGQGDVSVRIDRGSDGDIDETISIDDQSGIVAPIYLPISLHIPYTPPALPLLNGDFEQGATGWTEASLLGWRVIVNSNEVEGLPTHSGVWSAWLGGDDNEISLIEQAVTVPPDRPYLTYYHGIGSEDGCGYDFGGVLIDGAVVDVYDLCADSSTSGWVRHVVNLSDYAGQTVALQIRVETDGSLNSNLFVDDVAFSSSAAAVAGGAPVPFRWSTDSPPARPAARAATEVEAVRLLGPRR